MNRALLGSVMQWACAVALAGWFWSGDALAELPEFMQKPSPQHIRIMTFNPNWDSIFEDGDPMNHDWREFDRSDEFVRIVTAVNPDIVCLQEINAYRDPQDVADILDAALPLGGGETWRAHNGTDNVIAARFDLSMLATDTIPTTNRDQAMALVDLPDGTYTYDLYLMNAHFKAGSTSEDINRRQQHADAIIHWIGDIKSPGGSIDLPADTPIVVLGDMNVYDTDPAHHLTTLVTGDIVDEGTYGPDVSPDWDDTDNADALPLHNGTGPDFWTWRDDSGPYNPGALDRIIYSDSAIGVGNSFVLNTTIMSAADLAAAGLLANDVVLDPSEGYYDHLPLVIDFLVSGGCDGDEDCDDGLFCNGVETCVDGVCVAGVNPCPGQWCDEDTDQCVDAPAFADDFESGNAAGWDLYAAGSTASKGDWEIGDPNGTVSGSDPAQPEDAYNGSGCAFTAQNTSLGTDDVDGGVVYLVSPAIDLSSAGAADLDYVRWFFNRDVGEDSGDFFTVDVSDDDGASWVNVETLDTNQNANLWTPRSFSLEGLISLTSTVRLRFGASDGTSGGNIIEAAIDDVQVWAVAGPEEYTLTVNVSGNGTVDKDPDQATYVYGQTVELTANADPGWTFDCWEGNLTGSANPDSITMDGDKTVTAVFLQDQYTLTINVTGNGTVDKDPDQATYTYGQVVELTANADPGWTFDRWEGDLTGSTNPDSITMDGDKTVTAVFALDCNGNGVDDAVDLATCDGSPWCDDCNTNDILDWCDIDEGTSTDANGNGVPDECDLPGDINGDGVVDFGDFQALGDCFTGPCPAALCEPALYGDPACALADFDEDGDIDLADFAEFQTRFGNGG